MNRKTIVFFAAFALILAGAGFLLYLKANQRLGSPAVRIVPVPLYDQDGKKITDNSIFLPESVDGSTSQVASVAIERKTLPLDTTLGKRIYHFPDGFEVMSSVVLMGNDRTSLHKPEICIVAGGWNIDSTEVEKIKIEKPMPYELPVTKLKTSTRIKDKDGNSRVIYGVYVYWFVADGQMTARHDERMIWMAKRILTTSILDRWAYVSCFSICGAGEETKTFERQEEFIAAAVPKFQLVPSPDKTGSLAPLVQ